MFKRNANTQQGSPPPVVQAVERITSVLGPGVIWDICPGRVTGRICGEEGEGRGILIL